MNKIFERRSVRKFKEKEVSMDLVKECLYAAMQAPSARGQIPWDFVVLDKDQIPDVLNASSGSRSLKECDKAIIFVMRDDLICPEFLQQDMSSALTCFMLQARDFGLGTIWIGICPNNDRMDYLNKYLNITKPFSAFAMCGIGYPTDENAFKLLEERFDDNRIHIRKW